MTKQEAIKRLSLIMHSERIGWNPHTVEAFQMAINALDEDKDVPSKDGDTISRHAAINAAHKNYDTILDFKSDGRTVADSFEDIINALPSVQLTQPKVLTDAERVICKMYMDDLDRYKTCNEYKILMKLLDGTVSAQPEITDEQAIKHLQSTGWMQHHDKQMYKMGLKEKLADDSDSYDSLIPSAQPEFPFETQDILDYLDTVLHPIVSPDHWIVYAELHDMISMLPSAQPETTHMFEGSIKDSLFFYCEECGEPVHSEYNYCPRCGRKFETIWNG